MALLVIFAGVLFMYMVGKVVGFISFCIEDDRKEKKLKEQQKIQEEEYKRTCTEWELEFMKKYPYGSGSLGTEVVPRKEKNTSSSVVGRTFTYASWEDINPYPITYHGEVGFDVLPFDPEE